ncbi:MAG TPA: hypothetical protein PLX66_00015 [Bacilli bacterium]|nr:hypothetical protein [Bacilli bacterium]
MLKESTEIEAYKKKIASRITELEKIKNERSRLLRLKSADEEVIKDYEFQKAQLKRDGNKIARYNFAFKEAALESISIAIIVLFISVALWLLDALAIGTPSYYATMIDVLPKYFSVTGPIAGVVGGALFGVKAYKNKSELRKTMSEYISFQNFHDIKELREKSLQVIRAKMEELDIYIQQLIQEGQLRESKIIELENREANLRELIKSLKDQLVANTSVEPEVTVQPDCSAKKYPYQPLLRRPGSSHSSHQG